jgi:hypothetical protein
MHSLRFLSHEIESSPHAANIMKAIEVFRMLCTPYPLCDDCVHPLNPPTHTLPLTPTRPHPSITPNSPTPTQVVISVVRHTLKQLLLAIDGTIVMSDSLTNAFNNMCVGPLHMRTHSLSWALFTCAHTLSSRPSSHAHTHLLALSLPTLSLQTLHVFGDDSSYILLRVSNPPLD